MYVIYALSITGTRNVYAKPSKHIVAKVPLNVLKLFSLSSKLNFIFLNAAIFGNTFAF